MKKLIDILKIKYPIIQAPMAGGITTPNLVAAVSNAGGLGSFAAGYLNQHEIRAAIKAIKLRTSSPFAVNLFVPSTFNVSDAQMELARQAITLCSRPLSFTTQPVVPPYTPTIDEQLQAIIEEDVPVVSFTFGIVPDRWINLLKKHQCILIGTATNWLEAKMNQAAGMDILVFQGKDAGGHRGTFIGSAEDSLQCLDSFILQANKLSIPCIAAGGIMDGSRISDLLNLGYAGVALGTTFLTSVESGLSSSFKQYLLANKNNETVLTRAFTGKLARGLRNLFIERMEDFRSTIVDYPVQHALTKAMRTEAVKQNNIDFYSMWVGKNYRHCRDASADQIFKRLIELNFGQLSRLR